jgi:lysyl-tRNA synthetase, class II
LAGWTVGVIATLSLLGSVSPLFRWLIKAPREFINDYLFNFPDTSIAWSFVLALLAAALTARKRIAWLLLLGNMVLAAALNAADIAAGDNTPAESFGENLGFALHIVVIVLLVLSYRQFWAKVRKGALLKAAAVLVAGDVIGILASWALVEMWPGTLAPDSRFWYVVNRVVGFSIVDPDAFTGRPHVILNAIFGLFGALALIAATIVLFQSQRADNALTGEDESAIRGLQERLPGLLRHPPRQVGGVRAQRPRRHHLPSRSRCLPGQR